MIRFGGGAAKKHHCQEGALSAVNHSSQTSGAKGWKKASRKDGQWGFACAWGQPAWLRGFPEEFSWGERVALEKCLFISQDRYNVVIQVNLLWVKAWKDQDYFLCQRAQCAESTCCPPIKHNNECLRECYKYFNYFSQVCSSISCF